MRDLEKLFRARFGDELPDDDSGRDDAMIAAHHLASLGDDPAFIIDTWFRRWAPWLSLKEAQWLIGEAVSNPKRWRADTLAWRMRLTEAERSALGITTIGAIDLSKSERAKRRRQRNIAAKRAARRAKGAMTRAQYLASVKTEKPWIKAGMSRATWYRRQSRET